MKVFESLFNFLLSHMEEQTPPPVKRKKLSILRQHLPPPVRATRLQKHVEHVTNECQSAVDSLRARQKTL